MPHHIDYCNIILLRLTVLVIVVASHIKEFIAQPKNKNSLGRYIFLKNIYLSKPSPKHRPNKFNNQTLLPYCTVAN